MVDDILLTVVDEAEIRKATEIARKMIRKGWGSTEIAETTELDIETVESFMDQLSSEEGVQHFIDTDNMLLSTFSEEAEQRKAKEIAQSLIEMGLPCEQIAKATKLDLATVQSLYRSAQS